MSEKLMDLSLNQLVEKLVKAGFNPEIAKTFKSKSQIVAVIESLAVKAEVPGGKSKVKLIDRATSGKETPKEKKMTDKAWLSKRDLMGRHLEAQEKVLFTYPIEPTEKPGVVESKVVDGIRQFKVISGAYYEKIMNGYKWILPKGRMTKIPVQIAEKLSEELDIMVKIGSKHSVDRIDERTGKPVGDALS